MDYIKIISQFKNNSANVPLDGAASDFNPFSPTCLASNIAAPLETTVAGG